MNYQDIGSSHVEGNVYGFRFATGSKIWTAASERNEFSCGYRLKKKRAFAVFIKKCLRPHGWSDTNFTAAAICSNQVKW